MGFIKSIFGLIGGIFKAILGVFGIGKKSEFYMELKEGDQPSDPAPAATAPAPVAPVETAAPVAVATPAPAPGVAAPPAPKPTQPAAPVPSFAANYLTGASMTSRRRPGPSLSPFKDMAKQVKAR